MVEIHNGILATCNRNAQSKKQDSQQTSNPPVTTAQTTARLTLQERLAAVTKGKAYKNISASSSEVTLSYTPTETKQQQANIDDSILIRNALDCVGTLEDVLSDKDRNISSSNVFDSCKKVQADISARIPLVSDPSNLGKRNKVDYVNCLILIHIQKLCLP